MLRLLLALFYLTQLVQGTSTNTTDSSCPPLDGQTRSVWSILGSCALTLLICVWHTIHFDFPRHTHDWIEKPVGLVLLSFFAPEMVVMVATYQWWEARRKVNRFHEKGYHWSMTHSFFAEMGGFVYRDNKGGLRTIYSLEFLELCEAGRIANPVITVKEIKDKSKSDALGKAILALQLLWFVLQVIARGSRGFAITLIELDTVCVAVLSLLVLFLWWNKPLRPECPHIFYSPQEVKVDPQMHSTLSKAWKAEPSYLGSLIACLTRRRETRSITDDEETALVGKDKLVPSKFNMVDRIDKYEINTVSSCGAWMALGALHLVAWNFDFLTEVEKILWRAASLVLTGCPLVFFGGWVVLYKLELRRCYWADKARDGIGLLLCALGLVSRVLLVALMLANLRSLPCSAYQTVSWTAYIPHL
ncbi:hypothetical protein JVT61DRAFT_4054 [Boletus reticuloceps]|uniref:XK-related protein n=1 Tax=Boletus reticuloceps TaxID=495285 RepID=A0A8I2YMR3_9AGAM|nr:hypothetical protein JVT61DRAFT_4054 [Boletus reticuloceps]